MKTVSRCLSDGSLFLLSVVIFALGIKVSAQTAVSNSIPVVTIKATQPLASGPGSPGVFTVFREGERRGLC